MSLRPGLVCGSNVDGCSPKARPVSPRSVFQRSPVGAAAADHVTRRTPANSCPGSAWPTTPAHTDDTAFWDPYPQISMLSSILDLPPGARLLRSASRCCPSPSMNSSSHGPAVAQTSSLAASLWAACSCQLVCLHLGGA
jgi:hypothetical protein